MNSTPQIDLAVANCPGDIVHLTLTVGGKPVRYKMKRETAAALISQIAEALA